MTYRGNGELGKFLTGLSIKPARERNHLLAQAAKVDLFGAGWSARTWQNQYYTFAKGGAVGTRKRRSGAGYMTKWDSLPEGTRKYFCALRKMTKNVSTKEILDIGVAEGMIEKGALSTATLNRALDREGYSLKKLGERRITFPFTFSKSNVCWQMDHSDSSIYLRMEIDGKVKKVSPDLFLIIDDRSRMTWGMYTLGHRLEHVNHVLCTGILPKHPSFYAEPDLHPLQGIPRLLYVDKALHYVSDQTKGNLARIGCTLLDTLPKMPTARGKVERRFSKMLKKKFEEMVHHRFGKKRAKPEMDLHPHELEPDPKATYEGLDLELLNALFWKYLLEVNARDCRPLGMCANQAYAENLHKLREVVPGDADANHFAIMANFMLRAEQQVSNWSTVTIRQAYQIDGEKITHKHEFEAPVHLAGQRVTVLYDHAMTDWVWLGVKGKDGRERMVGIARRTHAQANSGLSRAQKEAIIAEQERMRRPLQVDVAEFAGAGDFVKQIAAAKHRPVAIPDVERVEAEPVELDAPERPDGSSQMALQSICRRILGRSLDDKENVALVAFHGNAGHIPVEEFEMQLEILTAEMGIDQTLDEYLRGIERRYGLSRLNSGRATG